MSTYGLKNISITQLDTHYKQIYMTKKSPEEKQHTISVKMNKCSVYPQEKKGKNLAEWTRDVFLEKASFNQIYKIVNFLQNRIMIKGKQEGTKSSSMRNSKMTIIHN